MFDVRCSVFGVRCSMFDVRCSMFDVRCSMFDVRCSMFDVRCSMFDEVPKHRIPSALPASLRSPPQPDPKSSEVNRTSKKYSLPAKSGQPGQQTVKFNNSTIHRLIQAHQSTNPPIQSALPRHSTLCTLSRSRLREVRPEPHGSRGREEAGL